MLSVCKTRILIGYKFEWSTWFLTILLYFVQHTENKEIEKNIFCKSLYFNYNYCLINIIECLKNLRFLMSLERRTEKEKIDEEKIRGNNALKHFNSRYCVFLIKSDYQLALHTISF